MRVVSVTRATWVVGASDSSRPATGGRLTVMGLAISRARNAGLDGVCASARGGTY